MMKSSLHPYKLTQAQDGQQLKTVSFSNKEQANAKPKGKLSLTSEIVYSRLDGARWHAVVAGALAGLSVLWEKKGRRITIAQQIFVRYVLIHPIFFFGLSAYKPLWRVERGVDIGCANAEYSYLFFNAVLCRFVVMDHSVDCKARGTRGVRDSGSRYHMALLLSLL
jgi:hypothetical protein